MPSKVAKSITSARDQYATYVKKVHSSTNKEVFKVYNHITVDLLNELLKEVMQTIDKDLDKYCEKVIYDEFQL